MPEPAIRARGLSKKFGATDAVRDVDLEVEQGEIFGFLGPNGAGKTTTINMLCTLAEPTSGSATVAGNDVVTDPDRVRLAIGLVFQDSALDGYLSAARNLRLHAELYAVPRAQRAERIEAALRMAGLWERRRDIVGRFSGGMKRRLEVARALLHSPKVLFLDEPTAGLDPQSRAAVWEHVDRLRREQGVTVFLTTHYLEEAHICDRIAIIDHGEIVIVDTPDKLRASVAEDRMQITTDDDELARAQLRERFGIEAGMHDGALTFAVADGEQFVPRLFEGLGVGIHSVRVTRPTLDDVFLSYTGRTIRDADAPDARGAALRMMMGGPR
ncbi:ABC transporter ATP-binding protein [Amycolatopsis acidicola]|uniref:ABC transporter ATP-binding protein n=1 Tax=Amycolatopsis acidicola TaxID=2596893 RepID=A0A5N0VJD2_9PSEU|nr:ATP-binding cassette domain-containing protein [Amycolatopsis acidicola]KAA9166497.1 ABC transporter ATP-binding protein [Amycolatopsis acidicola]